MGPEERKRGAAEGRKKRGFVRGERHKDNDGYSEYLRSIVKACVLHNMQSKNRYLTATKPVAKRHNEFSGYLALLLLR